VQVVAGMITHTGWELGVNSVHSLTDRVDDKEIKEYQRVISEVCADWGLDSCIGVWLQVAKAWICQTCMSFLRPDRLRGF
jgi:divalent metal cation (Fe/Co/Zn/Cd) transporter